MLYVYLADDPNWDGKCESLPANFTLLDERQAQAPPRRYSRMRPRSAASLSKAQEGEKCGIAMFVF